jgi:hypothetical protein
MSKVIDIETLKKGDRLVVVTLHRTYHILVVDPMKREAIVQDDKRFPTGVIAFMPMFEAGYGLKYLPKDYNGGILTTNICEIRLNDLVVS